MVLYLISLRTITLLFIYYIYIAGRVSIANTVAFQINLFIEISQAIWLVWL